MKENSSTEENDEQYKLLDFTRNNKKLKLSEY